MKKPRYTAEQVARAIINAEGIKSVAARILKCNRRTIDESIKRYPTCEAAYRDAMEEAGDVCESALMTLVHQGNPSAIIFALKTRFRNRGYGAKDPPPQQEPFMFKIDLGSPSRT